MGNSAGSSINSTSLQQSDEALLINFKVLTPWRLVTGLAVLGMVTTGLLLVVSLKEVIKLLFNCHLWRWKHIGSTLDMVNGSGLHSKPVQPRSQTRFLLSDSVTGDITYDTGTTDYERASHERFRLELFCLGIVDWEANGELLVNSM